MPKPLSAARFSEIRRYLNAHPKASNATIISRFKIAQRTLNRVKRSNSHAAYQASSPYRSIKTITKRIPLVEVKEPTNRDIMEKLIAIEKLINLPWWRRRASV